MAERILASADGSIREQGTHEQLPGLGGRYAELFERLAGGSACPTKAWQAAACTKAWQAWTLTLQTKKEDE